MELNSANAAPTPPNLAGFDDPAFISQIRRDMLRFATLQLQDGALAEDAVQEALMAAHQNIASFGRKAAFKTWVFAILKHKIVDVLRKGHTAAMGDETADDISDMLFNERGFWHADEHPGSWSAPMSSVKDDHFWRMFEACLDGLPEHMGRVFMMREFIELDSDEICQTLHISTSNLHVVLYRARLRLRECLENRWFREGEQS
ncbi:sigma-70 family RNA polymerase sigma factor [Shewanella sp. YIC-542]|uniref:sigma-70 family RNA polymerase sigma factor n=1 Tax=Shewanella mytili TaxID=3377111 RepID=UPI00398E4A52